MNTQETSDWSESIIKVLNGEMSKADTKFVLIALMDVIVGQQARINLMARELKNTTEAVTILTSGGKMPTNMGSSSGGFSIG